MGYLGLNRDRLAAVVVSVNYWDYLEITLPRLCEHVDRAVVVTDLHDHKTPEIVAKEGNALCLGTDVFYANKAAFNKYAAVEQALDFIGREGWLLCIDADILLPEKIEWPVQKNKLYGARRHDHASFSPLRGAPPELLWPQFPFIPDAELAGFFHLFHADSCPPKPWYGIDWTGANGGDSDFEAKWPADRKERLNLDVMHLGSPDRNWHGRVNPYPDGTLPPDAQEHFDSLHEAIAARGFVGGKLTFPKEKIFHAN